MNSMTISDEGGWVSCKAPRLMLQSLKVPGRQGLISRELRLFACACVRHIGELLEFGEEIRVGSCFSAKREPTPFIPR
jgi:hypothetical protein